MYLLLWFQHARKSAVADKKVVYECCAGVNYDEAKQYPSNIFVGQSSEIDLVGF